MKIFNRTKMAEDMAGKLLIESPTSAASSGLFLAAPRRTGKSTYMREDLRPALEARGARVVYADLWADRSEDPGKVIVQAVRAELVKYVGKIQRTIMNMGIKTVNIGGVSISLEHVGLGGGVSLSVALAALSDECRCPIVMIIDEAQHALTSQSGNDALFALKAARDELNSSRHFGLRIVATGSNRDKLAVLRNDRDQAFFGAPLVSFQPLDADYVKWFCADPDLPARLDPQQVLELFKRAASRPEILCKAVDQLRSLPIAQLADASTLFSQAVQAQIDEGNQEQLCVLRSLTPMQSAVLRVMVARGNDYAPFEAGTLAAYQDVLRAIGFSDDFQVNISVVQEALQALQDNSIIWRAARGIYALEESSLKELMESKNWLAVVPPLRS